MGAISLKSCCLSAAASAVRAPGAPGSDSEDDDEVAAAAAATKGLSAKELEGPVVVRRRGGAETEQCTGAARSGRGQASGDMALKNPAEKGAMREMETQREREEKERKGR